MKKTGLTGILFLSSFVISFAFPRKIEKDEPNTTSTQKEAIRFIDSVQSLLPSPFWPDINPAVFLENVRSNIHEPLSVYPGSSTNFCGYGALTYLILQDDPLGYAKLLLQLFNEGNASFGKTHFTPSREIRTAAGRLKFKGILDIHPAEQMWYLCLADHFKGYLNFFNRTYDPGDENTFWASVNYAKFNRMVRQLLNFKVTARGGDIFRPSVGNTFNYISEKLKSGTVVLFINNRILHKKKLEKIRLAVPTHFIVLQNIYKEENTVTLTYWDYGSRTLRQLRSYFLHKIIFGITTCTKKDTHE